MHITKESSQLQVSFQKKNPWDIENKSNKLMIKHKIMTADFSPNIKCHQRILMKGGKTNVTIHLLFNNNKGLRTAIKRLNTQFLILNI